MTELSTLSGGRFAGDVERTLRDALRNLRYGTVTLVVQDGRIIQIEKNEKFRFNKGEHIHGSGI